MRAPEFWVMRAVLHQKGKRRGQAVTLDECTPGSFVAVLALVNAGDYCLLPDGTICEPVEVYAEQVLAQAHRDRLAAEMPGEDFRLVMNLDAPV